MVRSYGGRMFKINKAMGVFFSESSLSALTLSVPHFRRHLSSAFLFLFLFIYLFFNKLPLGKKFICKVKD